MGILGTSNRPRAYCSLGGKLNIANGRPSGFDYLRISLAVAVLAAHGTLTTEGWAADHAVWESPLRTVIRAILPMFFALSGFLVAGSLERCRTLFSFLGLRMIRIYPALAVEVLLSAFIIGLSTTTLSPSDYLLHPEFHRYLLNAIGDIHYALPGVFARNPDPSVVNRQLWTVPWELGCYVLLALLAVLGIVQRPIWGPIAVATIFTTQLAYRIAKHHGHYGHILGAVPGALLVASFLCGLSLYLYREKVSWRKLYIALSAFVALISFYFLSAADYLGVVAISYLTIAVGVTNVRRSFVIRGADLSYGVYLYGFAIQQLFAYLFPQWRVWWASMLVCIPAALIVAAASWNLIEKPALKLKKWLFRIEKAIFPLADASLVQAKVRPGDSATSREI